MEEHIEKLIKKQGIMIQLDVDMAYPNRNLGGGGPPSNFNGANIFDDDPDFASYVMSVSNVPFSSAPNMFMSEFQNDPFANQSGLMPDQGAPGRNGFNFNPNAATFVPSFVRQDQPQHQGFPGGSQMGDQALNRNPMRHSNAPGQPVPNAWGMPRQGQQQVGYSNRMNQQPAPAPRRNIYGPQYSQATMDNNYHPDYQMQQQLFQQMQQYGGQPNAIGIDPAENFSLDENDALFQQMEAAGLAIHEPMNLPISPQTLNRVNNSQFADTLHEMVVGLEQICQPVQLDEQCHDWGIAIKGCVQKISDIIDRQQEHERQYPQSMNPNADSAAVARRRKDEIVSITCDILLDAMLYTNKTAKRLGECAGNMTIYLFGLRSSFLKHLSNLKLPESCEVKDLVDFLLFTTVVLRKVYDVNINHEELATQVLKIIAVLIERKPTTDNIIKACIKTFKEVGVILDTFPRVIPIVDVTLTKVYAYAVGSPQVSAAVRQEMHHIVDVRERGWPEMERCRFASDDDASSFLTEDEQQFLDTQLPNEQDDVQEEYEKFLTASRDTALGVVNNCLEEGLDDLKLEDSGMKPSKSSTSQDSQKQEKGGPES
ncbi:hypothetical protein L596_002270 [Steinernema carpocapsae]|uniref:MIF4G domain-containing protein n=2 Tax=Steinernema carpocapsae TaxID=34508 RepID=A0A4U8USQ1_STECR|nr:hypothetical protein L596_002270 [Steinernema carpocapsae]